MPANADEPAPAPGISPVTQSARSARRARVFVALAASALLIVVLSCLLLAHWLDQRQRNGAQGQAASQLVTAASAGAAPLKLAQDGAGPAPSAGGLAPDGLPGVRLEDIRIPAIDPGAVGLGPIGVLPAQGATLARGASGPAVNPAPNPYDAPVLLAPAAAPPDAGPGSATGAGVPGALDERMAQARARLEESRARLEQALKGIGGATGPAANPPGPGAGGGRENELKVSSTARIGAAQLVAPSFTLARGMSFGCALASKIVSEQTGPVSCIVARNVYGSDGRVLLIERGAHLDGAYHAQLRVGQSRLAVLWERLRMPNGVVVDLASNATGALGEAGADGALDNHWPERIGAALFLSFIDDAVKIEIAREQAKGNAAGTVLLQGSGSDGSTLAGKVLDSTLNIAPTVVKNQGEILAVSVAQDVDFSTVYELHAAAR